MQKVAKSGFKFAAGKFTLPQLVKSNTGAHNRSRCRQKLPYRSEELELKKVTKIYEKETRELLHLQTSTGRIDTTSNHPFYVIGKGWVAAGDIETGDDISLAGSTTTVLGWEYESCDEAIIVYNLEVEDFNSYFVGPLGVLVHNYKGTDIVDDVVEGGGKTAKGQLHHILSNKTMKALNEHPTLKGVFEREDAAFKYRAKDANAHKGYQQWHRDVDSTTVDWLQNNPNATPEQFKKFLNDMYQQPDISSKIPGVNIP